MFFKGSRYEKVANAHLTDADGREITYKRIRFIQETPANFRHTVSEGERLDLIANQYYRNPELFWRICDANKAMLPNELVVEVGSRILIPPAQR